MNNLYELESEKPQGGKMVIYLNSASLVNSIVTFRNSFPDEILVSVRLVPQREITEAIPCDFSNILEQANKLLSRD